MQELTVYIFGLDSFDRFKEKSIVTSNKILPISFKGASITPGKETFMSFYSLLNVEGLTIIPRDPITKMGWKNLSFEYLAKQTGEALQKGLEKHSYMYEAEFSTLIGRGMSRLDSHWSRGS